MAIDRQRLLEWEVPDVVHTYTERDTILYALGLGVGDDPLNPDQLRFVYEKDLKALPMMSVVLGYPGLWMSNPETGIDWKRLLHGEQGFEVFKPIPARGSVIGRTRVVDVIDKGAERGAIVLVRRDVIERDSGDLLCQLTSTSILRGDGGFGGPTGPVPEPHRLPDRAPECIVERKTSARSALIYRLSGDYNPLHVDPAVAREAQLERPILHGLCTFGVAGLALVSACCGSEPASLTAMRARFTSPVIPGETIRTEIWIDPDHVSFRAWSVERNALVLNNGWAQCGERLLKDN